MKKNFGGLKKLLALALVAVTVMGTAVPSIQVEAAKKKSSGATYAVGDDIAFDCKAASESLYSKNKYIFILFMFNSLFFLF